MYNSGAEAVHSGRRPRLLYVIQQFPKYSETFILREILSLRRAGFELKICSLEKPAHPVVHEAAAPLLSDVEYFPGWKSDPRIDFESYVEAAAGWVAALARAYRPGLIHAHFALVAASVARVASRASGIPYSVTAHATDVRQPNPLLGWNLEKAALVVACNRRNRGFLARRFPALRRRIRYAYHGLDLREFHAARAARPPRRSLRLLVVARLERVKGVEQFLEACALLLRRGVAFRGTVVGDGEELQALLKRAAALGLGRRVAFAGALSQREVRRRYLGADILVQPSVVTPTGQSDNLPNTVLEAMALGLPVVASRLGAIAEAIAHGRNGLLVPPRDPAALARAILSLRRAPRQAARLARRARRTVEERYDIDRSPLAGLLSAACSS